MCAVEAASLYAAYRCGVCASVQTGHNNCGMYSFRVETIYSILSGCPEFIQQQDYGERERDCLILSRVDLEASSNKMRKTRYR